MYYYLHGIIAMHTKDSIIVECGGVGYDVVVTHPDEFSIGETLFVFVHYVHSENEQYFIGFKTLKEKELFQALISVKGIGPKTALSCMRATSCERLSTAIQEADVGFLMHLPGVGKKFVSQIILDLKGKLSMVVSEETYTLSKNMDLAKEGLKTMGFKEKEIKDALLQIDETDLSTEEYIRRALAYLNNN